MPFKHRLFHLMSGAALAFVLGLSAVEGAEAHDFWIQPERFRVAPDKWISMTLQVGHGGDRQKSLIGAERIVGFYSVGPSGRTDRKSELRLGDPEIDTRLRFRSQGLHMLALESTGAFSELPAERFETYLKDEGLTPALTYRAQLNETGRPGRETYSRRAKALVQAGNHTTADDAVATTPVGLTLEIVPEINPYAPGYAGKLPLTVYYQGKALPGATVMLNNLAFDGKPLARILTDSAGRAQFDIPTTGAWQLNVVWTRPVTGDPDHDFETVFSSLTFGF